MTPQEQIDAAREVTCNTKEDCELKWARATKWIQDNSYWKLRTVTDNLLTTEGPMNEVYTAYEVTKFPKGDSVYEIQFKAGCHNMGLGCHPSIGKATASFKRYVATGDTISP
jgi:hypothetical protein